MIYCLSGELLFTDAVASTAVIDCCGVGYKVTVTSNTLRKLPVNSEKPPRIRLLTYMQVREDGVDLFGFYTSEELDMFKLLISVSGVGPKAALAILSIMTPSSFAMAVNTGDAKAISKANGVGPKTAARVILELKDKLTKELGNIAVSNSAPQATHVADTSKYSDALNALIVLGYSRMEAANALRGLDTASLSLEELITASLKNLMK